MRLPHFHYVAPSSVEEACRALAGLGKGTHALAGGTDLLVKMKQRRLVPAHLVNLKTIPGLDYIRFDEADELLRIGALATIQAIKNSAVVRRSFTVLNQAAAVESSVQIRNRATLGGNIANASPAADAPLALVVHGADLLIAGPAGEREVPIGDFFIGPGRTILTAGEIIREVRVPRPPAGSGGAYLKHAVRRTDIAIVSTAVLLTMFEGVCIAARIGLGSVAPTAIRAKKAEETLLGRRVTEEVTKKASEEAAREARPIDDIRGYADYRVWTLRQLVERAISDALKESKVRGI